MSYVRESDTLRFTVVWIGASERQGEPQRELMHDATRGYAGTLSTNGAVKSRVRKALEDASTVELRGPHGASSATGLGVPSSATYSHVLGVATLNDFNPNGFAGDLQLHSTPEERHGHTLPGKALDSLVYVEVSIGSFAWQRPTLAASYKHERLVDNRAALHQKLSRSGTPMPKGVAFSGPGTNFERYETDRL